LPAEPFFACRSGRIIHDNAKYRFTVAELTSIAAAISWIFRFWLLIAFARFGLAEFTPEKRIAERAEQYRLIQALAGVRPQRE